MGIVDAVAEIAEGVSARPATAWSASGGDVVDFPPRPQRSAGRPFRRGTGEQGTGQEQESTERLEGVASS